MKLMPLADYIVQEFNKKAERFDKIKVILLTISITFFTTIISVQGVVSFLDIKGKLWPNILVVLFALGYFHTYRLWFIGHTLIGKFDQDEKTEKDKT
jgi:hypothetical protein